jgi:hypothetical protein
MRCYLFLTKQDDAAVLVVEIANGREVFPLTKTGCTAAGRYLFDRGIYEYTASSGLDFPREYKRGFKGNVHDMVIGALQAEVDKAAAAGWKLDK